jgi:APA family basic amino acid/polyamine antiporter
MRRKVFGYVGSTSLIIASMIGTGVFTSLGMQIQSISSVSAVLLLWVLGGISSLAGALCYAELGAAHPRSGGEYHLLRVIYHPALGFLAGVTTLIAGLAAPVALSATAFAAYARNILPFLPEGFPSEILSVGIILGSTALHSWSARLGVRLHSGITGVNIALILIFILFAAFFPSVPPPAVLPDGEALQQMVSADYAVAFVFVAYAYLGWNTSVYIIDELREPQKILPRSVITGVLAVTALYALLNYSFLRAAPVSELSGKIDVGYVAAKGILGETGGAYMSALIALALVGSVSSYIVLAPRVWRAMGQDYSLLKFAAGDEESGIPKTVFWIQAAVAVAIVVTSSFEAILTFAGLLLTLYNLLAVVGVIVLRVRRPELPRPYKAWGYPATPILFAAIALWMIFYVAYRRPLISLFGLLTVAAAFALQIIQRRKE